MHSLIPYFTGLGCSICYGVATILEQVAAKRQENIDSLHPIHIVKLIKQTPYVLGIVLDLVGWALFLITARTLPLFLTLSFVVLSLVVTAIIARIFLSIQISYKEKFAMALIVISIVVLGIIAQPSMTYSVNKYFILLLEVGPLPIALLSVFILKAHDKRHKLLMLSGVAGVSFGATGLISRISNFTGFELRNIFHIIILSLLAYGAIGLVTLSAALQEGNVNRVNSIVYTSELVLPSLLGMIFLNDKVKQGLWPLLFICLAGVIAGTYIFAFDSRVESRKI
jgi:hypothetical protein